MLEQLKAKKICNRTTRQRNWCIRKESSSGKDLQTNKIFLLKRKHGQLVRWQSFKNQITTLHSILSKYSISRLNIMTAVSWSHFRRTFKSDITSVRRSLWAIQSPPPFYQDTELSRDQQISHPRRSLSQAQQKSQNQKVLLQVLSRIESSRMNLLSLPLTWFCPKTLQLRRARQLEMCEETIRATNQLTSCKDKCLKTKKCF